MTEPTTDREQRKAETMNEHDENLFDEYDERVAAIAATSFGLDSVPCADRASLLDLLAYRVEMLVNVERAARNLRGTGEVHDEAVARLEAELVELAEQRDTIRARG